MTPEQLINRAQYVPFVRNGADFSGLDCFGFLEIWHELVHGIKITDRKANPSSPDGFRSGYSAQTDWTRCDGPENGAVAVMPGLFGRRIIDFGHCGMFWNDRVWHFEEPNGLAHFTLTDPTARHVSTWMKHRLL